MWQIDNPIVVYEESFSEQTVRLKCVCVYSFVVSLNRIRYSPLLKGLCLFWLVLMPQYIVFIELD